MSIETANMTVGEFLAKADEFGFGIMKKKYADSEPYIMYTADSGQVVDSIGSDMFNEEVGYKPIYDTYGNYTGQDATVHIITVKAVGMTIYVNPERPDEWIEVTVSYECSTTWSRDKIRSYIEYTNYDGVKDWTMSEFIEDIEKEIWNDIRCQC